MHRIQNKGSLLTVLLTSILVLAFFWKPVTHLNTTLFSAKGDGVQSYYNMLYHVKHDSAYWHSSSMNYPYGEHSFFTNNYYMITNPVKWISENVLDISNYTIGIVNAFMLLSIVLTAYCLFILLKRWKLPDWYSLIVAIGITFLSPQLVRLHGHFALAQGFVIPLSIYLILEFFDRRTLKASLKLALVLSLIALFNFYYFALVGFIIGGYWAVKFLLEKEERNWLFAIKHGFIHLGIPFLIVQFLGMATDNVIDRTTSPWGFFNYHSNPNGVFVPLSHPVSPILGDLVGGLGRVQFEGKAFIGFVADFFILVLLFAGVRFIFTKGLKRHSLIFQAKSEVYLFLIAFGALLVSFGLPFAIPGLQKGVEYLAIFKQLRSIGRFNWIFFYVINIAAFVFLYQYIIQRKRTLQILLFVFVLGVLWYDAIVNLNRVYPKVYNQEELLTDVEGLHPKNQLLMNLIGDVNQYQAILSLPSFHVGSESIWTPIHKIISHGSFKASFQTGLPLTSVHGARTSLGQTYKNVSMTAEAYRPLEILKDYPNEKSLLVLAQRKVLSANDKRILQNGEYLGDWQGLAVYQLPFEALKNNHNGLYDNYVAQFDSILPVSQTYIEKDFDELGGKALRGTGAFLGKVNGPNDLLKGEILVEENGRLMLSFWMKDVQKDRYPRSDFSFKVYNQNREVVSEEWNSLFRYFVTYDQDWVLVEIPSKKGINPGVYHVEVFTTNAMKDNDPFVIDELLLRQEKDSIYHKVENGILFNNRLYIEGLN